VVIIIRMAVIWSCKKINCSMIGDDVFWKLNCSHVAIFNN